MVFGGIRVLLVFSPSRVPVRVSVFLVGFDLGTISTACIVHANHQHSRESVLSGSLLLLIDVIAFVVALFS